MDTLEMKRVLAMLKSRGLNQREEAIKTLTDYGVKEPDEVLKEIHKLINKGNEFEKQSAYEIVGHIRSDSSIPILLKKLTDNDPKIREHASNTICKYEKPPKSLVSGINQLLFHKRGEVKLRALSIIESLKIEDSLDDLFVLIREERSEHPHVTQEIYRVLKVLKNLRSIPVLLEDSSSPERDNTIQEITKKYGKEKVEPFWADNNKQLDEIPENLLKNSDLIEALLEGIKSTNDLIRINSLYLFCKIADEKQFDLIRGMLKDSNPEIRKMSLKWLANYKRKESGKELINFLGDSDVNSTSLNLLEDSKWLEVLISNGLKSENPTIRGSSATILVKVGEKSVVNNIIESLNTEEDDEIKSVFVKALGDLEDSRAIPFLLNLSLSSIELISQTSLDSLAKIGDIDGITESLHLVVEISKMKSIDKIEKMKGKIREVVSETSLVLPFLHQVIDLEIENLSLQRGVLVIMGELSDSGSEKYFYDALVNNDPLTREIVARAIAKYDQETTIKKLVPLLESSEESIRWGAIDALRVIAKEETRQSIEKRLVQSTEVSANVRKALCTALGAIGNQESANRLINVLTDPEPVVRIEAIRSLALINNPKAFIPLFEKEETEDQEVKKEVSKALNQLSESLNIKLILNNFRKLRVDDEKIRNNAIESLANLKENSSSYLEKGLSAKNSLVREGCCTALGQQKYSPARAILEQLTEDEVDKVRIAAIQALEKIGNPESTEIIIPRLADKETRDLGEKIWETSVSALASLNNPEILLKKAYDPNKNVRIGILNVLGIIKTGIDVIILLLEDFDYQVRAQAAIACGNLENSKAIISLLVRLSNDDELRVRVNAAEALGKIGDIEAVYGLFESEEQMFVELVTTSTKAIDLLGKTPEEKELMNLFKSLKNKDEKVRDNAISQLIELDDSKRFLKKFLFATNPFLRASSSLALGRLNDYESTPRIRELLTDKEILVRTCSAEALGLLKDEDAIPSLIERIKKKKEELTIKELCTDALVSIGSPSMNKLVESYTGHEHKISRRLMTQAFERIADPECIKPLINFGLRDKDEEVRETAIRTLIHFGEPVIKEITSIQEDRKTHARMAAVRVLGEVGSLQAMRKIEVALNDKDVQVRKTAGDEFTKASLSAVKSLCRCLASPRKETALLAGQILLNLAPEMKQQKEFHAIRFLRSALKKRDKELQAIACQALGTLGDNKTTRDLVSMLNSKHDNVRSSAVKSLGIMNDGRAIPPLELMLNDKSVEVRIAATEALEELDKRGIEAQVDEELIDYVQKPTGIKGIISQSLGEKRGTLLKAVSSDIGEIGLEGVLAKSEEIKTTTTDKIEKESKKLENQLKKIIEKLEQLEKLRLQKILNEEEFKKGQLSAINEINEIVKTNSFSGMNPEEVGNILKKLTELNKSGILPSSHFEPIRAILVKELIS